MRPGRALAAVAVVAALGGLGSLAWWARRGAGSAEAGVETEVAVHVGQIARRTVRSWVTAYGVVEPEPPGLSPAADARVSPATPGVVAAVDCTEGQAVAKGQLLFQLDSRVADVAVDKARHALESANTTLERQRKLMAVEGTSRRRLQEAEQAFEAAQVEVEAAETRRALLRVVAPMEGIVARVAVTAGDGVDITTTLAEIINLDRLVVSAGVPSAELHALKVGQRAEIESDGAVAPLTGSVAAIRPGVDDHTGTALVRISVPARSGLRPGLLVTVRIVSEEHEGRLTVPVDSLVKDAEGRSVIALVRDGRAVQTPVTTGIQEAGRVEIAAEGLEEGLTVVTEGAYALPPETKIRVIGP